MDVQQRIEELVHQQVANSPFFLVDVRISGAKSTPKLSVTLDGDAGIPIDACAHISRWLGQQIDEENLIASAYTLEVSSPGIDQPLRLPRQYPQHVGRRVQVTLTDGQTKTGKLLAVHEDRIAIATEQTIGKKKAEPIPEEIPLPTIQKTVVLVSF